MTDATPGRQPGGALSDHDLVFGGAAGPETLCPKCASGELKPHYHQSGTECDRTRARVREGREHLHFVCGRCQFERTTPCADVLALV